MLTRREVIASGAAAAGASLIGGGASAASAPLVVSVITTERPGGVSYLEATVAAIDRELPPASEWGDERRLLVYDGFPPRPRPLERAPAPAWLRYQTARTREERYVRGRLPNNREPGMAALRHAARIGAALLFAEDDVEPVEAGALARAAAHQVAPGCAWTSFFHRLRKPGIYDAVTFDMSQLVLLPAATVRAIVEYAERYPDDLRNIIGIDLAIGQAGRALGMRYELTAPLVRHVGLVSAVARPSTAVL